MAGSTSSSSCCRQAGSDSNALGHACHRQALGQSTCLSGCAPGYAHLRLAPAASASSGPSPRARLASADLETAAAASSTTASSPAPGSPRLGRGFLGQPRPLHCGQAQALTAQCGVSARSCQLSLTLPTVQFNEAGSGARSPQGCPPGSSACALQGQPRRPRHGVPINAGSILCRSRLIGPLALAPPTTPPALALAPDGMLLGCQKAVQGSLDTTHLVSPEAP